MVSGPSLASVKTPEFLAFVSEPASLKAAEELANDKGWGGDAVRRGNVADAISYLGEHPCPSFLLVEIPTAEEAPDLLDRLADVCNPNVKVIVTSKVDEFSFYSWLMEIGIHHYLLQPFSKEALDVALMKNVRKEQAADAEDRQGEVIACVGTRGGVGATTFACNLAYLLAKTHNANTALLDADAYFGSAAMLFDLQPGHGLRDALDKPDRVDGLFLDRVMVSYHDKLHVLSAEESFTESVGCAAQAAEVLLKQLRQHYEYVVVDVPRTITPFTRTIVEQADRVIMVTDMSLLGLRDSLRYDDLIRKEMRKQDIITVASKVGASPKHEIKIKDFEKHYGHKIDVQVPHIAEALTAAASGELLVDNHKLNGQLNGYKHMAASICGGEEEDDADVPVMAKSKLLSKLWKGAH